MSYYLQLKKIQAVHETVISIFAGERSLSWWGERMGSGDGRCGGGGWGTERLYLAIGMFVGLIIRLFSAQYIQGLMKFNDQFFFNLLLPPIILNSGYELHQVRQIRDSMGYAARN